MTDHRIEYGPEGSHRLVGRILAAEDSILSAMSATPHDAQHTHALDLLAIARDAVHRAAVQVWGKAPEIPEQPSANGGESR